jgi:two-component system, OmpR family, sensor histidine kinase MtrB
MSSTPSPTQSRAGMSSTPSPTQSHGAGLRRRLVLGFVAVAVVTALIVTALAYATSLYFFANGTEIIPETLRHWLREHVADPSLGSIVAFTALAVLVLVATVVVASSVAVRRVLLPVRQLAGAAERLSAGDFTVRLPEAGHDELTDLVRQFNQMATSLEYNVRELRRMNERARRFAGDVSHELRTPLAAMTAVTEVLDEHALAVTDDSGRAAALVSQEIRHLNGLIEALIEITRFDAGTADLVPDSVDIGVAIAQCLAIRHWTGMVSTEVAPGLRGVIDPRRFDVIVANLVGNAFAHGRPPVALRAWIEPTEPDDLLHVEVRDHGPGIPPEAMAQVFNRFFKADTARGRSSGSGLGLAIAWENARLHGGGIRVANHPGGGAVFLATIRLLEAP